MLVESNWVEELLQSHAPFFYKKHCYDVTEHCISNYSTVHWFSSTNPHYLCYIVHDFI